MSSLERRIWSKIDLSNYKSQTTVCGEGNDRMLSGLRTSASSRVKYSTTLLSTLPYIIEPPNAGIFSFPYPLQTLQPIPSMLPSLDPVSA
jgi:hypothetical protein